MTITISNPKPLVKNTLRGFFDLELPSGLKLNGCALHQKDGRRWIGLPAREWTKPSGEKSWTPMVEIPGRDARDRFNESVVPLAEKALGL